VDNYNDFFTSESIGAECRKFEKVYIFRCWRSSRSTNEPSTVLKYPDMLGIREMILNQSTYFLGGNEGGLGAYDNLLVVGDCNSNK
jgi:hypothetical protein